MEDNMKNELYVKEDVIYLICHGKQDKWVVQNTITRLLELRKTIEATGTKPKCLVDLKDNDGYDVEARNVAIEGMKDDPLQTAIVGANLAMQTVVNFMVKVAGQGNKFRAFYTTEEGEKWLREH